MRESPDLRFQTDRVRDKTKFGFFFFSKKKEKTVTEIEKIRYLIRANFCNSFLSFFFLLFFCFSCESSIKTEREEREEGRERWLEKEGIAEISSSNDPNRRRVRTQRGKKAQEFESRADMYT